MARAFTRCLLALFYGTFVYLFLRRASPVFIDGGEPMPSFFWGSPPVPELGEYYSRQAYYDLVYAIPYLGASIVLTIAGCVVAPKLARHPTAFSSVSATALMLLLILAAISDVGSLLRWWNGPLFLLAGDFSFYRLFTLAKLVLPFSLLAGVVTVIGERALRMHGYR